MSEIEKAIQEIEDMAYHSSLKTNITTQSMCVILKALQEKTEREKHPNGWIPVSDGEYKVVVKDGVITECQDLKI